MILRHFEHGLVRIRTKLWIKNSNHWSSVASAHTPYWKPLWFWFYCLMTAWESRTICDASHDISRLNRTPRALRHDRNYDSCDENPLPAVRLVPARGRPDNWHRWCEFRKKFLFCYEPSSRLVTISLFVTVLPFVTSCILSYSPTVLILSLLDS